MGLFQFVQQAVCSGCLRVATNTEEVLEHLQTVRGTKEVFIHFSARSRSLWRDAVEVCRQLRLNGDCALIDLIVSPINHSPSFIAHILTSIKWEKRHNERLSAKKLSIKIENYTLGKKTVLLLPDDIFSYGLPFLLANHPNWNGRRVWAERKLFQTYSKTEFIYF